MLKKLRARRTGLLLASLGVAIGAAALPAGQLRAQERFADEPTAGPSLPATPIAGDHDATAVSVNPAGLVFLGAWHLELAYTGLDENGAEGPGAGVGFYAATPLRLPFLPRLGFGVAVEQLLPPRVALAPDPGKPVRLSLATAYEWKDDLAFGAAWRVYSDDGGGVLDGVQSLDLGMSLRAGPYVALGAVVRDLNTPVVDGVPVQRRYQGELTWRPTGNDRLEIAAGVTVGERRLDVDPDVRFGVRLMPGLYLRGEVAMLSRWELANPAFDTGYAEQKYGVRASLGLEVSFGSSGAALYATGGRGVGGGTELLGATAVLRWSGERLQSVVPDGAHMEKIELTGAIPQPRLTALILGMRRMERDDDVKAVLIKVDQVGLGWAGAEDVRDAIHRLRKRGKKVVAYLVAGTTRDYYIAAAADAVLLDAAGGLRLQGLVGVTLYYKGMFDKLGIVAQFEKIEEYKSAPEAFTQEGPSKEAKEVRDSLFDDIFGRLLSEVGADRKRAPADVGDLIDSGPFTAAEAGKAKLVDYVVEPDDLEAKLAEALGGKLYPLGAPGPRPRDDTWARRKIAVIYVDGDIIDGRSRTIPLLGEELVGGDTIADSIAWARNNPAIEAIVLRVDSPGGSALASEVMAREVKATKGVKPIIVSMGDVAASGGYFCAAYGDLIYAQPSTITGSIGIFTGKVDVSGLLAKLGLTWDLTTRGKHADMETYYRAYTDDERKAIKEKLRYYYGRFVKTVAEGRGMKEDDVDKVARGHVWTGAQAKEHGLVDRIGGIYDAIAEAKSLAGIREDERVEIVNLPRTPDDFLGTVLHLMGGGSEGNDNRAVLDGVPIVADLWRALPWSMLLAPDSAQARLPFALILQ